MDGSRRDPHAPAVGLNGVSLVIPDMPAPYDRETIERWPEVRALMGGGAP